MNNNTIKRLSLIALMLVLPVLTHANGEKARFHFLAASMDFNLQTRITFFEEDIHTLVLRVQ